MGKKNVQISKAVRQQIVMARNSGMSWPKVAELAGCARSTVQRIYKQDSNPVISLEEVKKTVEIEEARVLKMVPNIRMMLIYFEHKEGIGRCIKRPNDNHPPKSMVLVRKVEGEDDLYRKA
jgi:DNA-binding phage protein